MSFNENNNEIKENINEININFNYDGEKELKISYIIDDNINESINKTIIEQNFDEKTKEKFLK